MLFKIFGVTIIDHLKKGSLRSLLFKKSPVMRFESENPKWFSVLKCA